MQDNRQASFTPTYVNKVQKQLLESLVKKKSKRRDIEKKKFVMKPYPSGL